MRRRAAVTSYIYAVIHAPFAASRSTREAGKPSVHADRKCKNDAVAGTRSSSQCLMSSLPRLGIPATKELSCLRLPKCSLSWRTSQPMTRVRLSRGRFGGLTHQLMLSLNPLSTAPPHSAAATHDPHLHSLCTWPPTHTIDGFNPDPTAYVINSSQFQHRTK
jgi:hypothetical protein